MAPKKAGSTFVQSLLFVNPEDEDSRKIIHSHAMREHRCRQRWQAAQARSKESGSGMLHARPLTRQIKHPSLKTARSIDAGDTAVLHTQADRGLLSPVSSPSTSHSDPEDFSQSSDFLGQEHSNFDLSPWPMLGTGKRNPFDTYPSPNSSKRVDMLVDFCELPPHPFGPISEPTANMRQVLSGLAYVYLGAQSDAIFNPAKELLIIPALRDPAPFLALLAESASGWDKMHGRAVGLESLTYKGQAIRIINDRLRTPEGALSNNTITAVTMLWALEV